MSPNTIRKLLILGLSAVCVFVGGGIGLGIWIDGHSRVATLTCGSSRSIKLSTSNFWDPLPDLLYQVYDKNKPRLQSMGFIGCTEQGVDPRDLHYQCLLSGDRTVVGVVVQTDPDVVLALYDFKSGKTWPYNWNTPWDEHKRKTTEMLTALQAAHADRQLRLLGEAEWIGGSKNMKLLNQTASRSASLSK